ncbi:uncharacterized protein EHS24_001480 [Apiotrichum porosum]|uniref:Uncharacterized protein n=1 Tax=Apiotrichum porosum TaxID=105984 RepID=A0A427XKV4_9TREE|nr:uncharacterized protein EHS24_001480 [Apiotrichum porosum]RSH79433.1 hypothetical protein EHS24_001480 [Apiotrichum porosum]
MFQKAHSRSVPPGDVCPTPARHIFEVKEEVKTWMVTTFKLHLSGFLKLRGAQLLHVEVICRPDKGHTEFLSFMTAWKENAVPREALMTFAMPELSSGQTVGLKHYVNHHIQPLGGSVYMMNHQTLGNQRMEVNMIIRGWQHSWHAFLQALCINYARGIIMAMDRQNMLQQEKTLRLLRQK